MKAPNLVASSLGRPQKNFVVIQRHSRRQFSDTIEADELPLEHHQTQRRRGLEDVHPFRGIEEYGLLHSLFFNTKSRSVLRPSSRKSTDGSKFADFSGFVQQIKRLREVEEKRISKSASLGYKASPTVEFHGNQLNKNLSKWTVEQSRFSQPLAGTVLSPESIEKIHFLMKDSNTRSLTALDIDNWLKLNIIFSESSHVVQELLGKAIDEMINSSTQSTLPVVMEFLQQYWKQGFEGIKPSGVLAKNQVISVLSRALKLLSSLETLEFSETPSPLEPYLIFYNNFMENRQSAEYDDLQDHWFRLVAQNGTAEMADELMTELYLKQNKLPSLEATDIFIQALIRRIEAQKMHFSGSEEEFIISVKGDLADYRALLVSSQVTPTVIEFLLLWTTTLDEVYSVVETAMNSEYSDWIMASCQVHILQSIVRCSLNADRNGREVPGLADPTYFVPIHAKAMAHMFGALNRFDKSAGGISPAALDECLLLSAKHGNSAGMYRAISMRLNMQSDNLIPASVISQVFDQFPIASGEMAKEQKSNPHLWIVNGTVVSDHKRDQVILYHLRTMIDMKSDQVAYQKYIGALGRCKRSDRLYWEWEEFVAQNSNWITHRDTVLQFICAHKAAESLDVGLKIIDQVMQASASDEGYSSAVSIIRHALRYRALHVPSLIKTISHNLINEVGPNKKWLGSDVEAIFEEISGDFNMSSQLAGTINAVRDGGNIGDEKRLLDDILERNLYGL